MELAYENTGYWWYKIFWNSNGQCFAKKAILDENGEPTPFNGLTNTLSFSTERAKEAGFIFSDLDSWIYKLIDHEIEK